MEDLTPLTQYAGVYGGYVAGACLRFFAAAGAMVFLLHVCLRRRWMALRIQKRFPEPGAISREVRASFVAILWSGFAGVLLYELIHRGWTRMYFDVSEQGWIYLVLSIVLGIAGYDTWFYWQHRMLHTPRWFTRAHAVHHRSTNPTPFANFAHTWIEISLGNVYFIGLVLLVPLHPVAFGAVSMFIFGWGMIAHSGYELYPAWFTRSRAFGWINSATHHNMHHSHTGCNYGMFFNFWDRAMKTNHPRYRETFDALRSSTSPLAPLAAPLGSDRIELAR